MADPKANLKEATEHIQAMYIASQSLSQATMGIAKAFGKMTGEEIKVVNLTKDLAGAGKNVASFGTVLQGVLERAAEPVHLNVSNIEAEIAKLKDQADELRGNMVLASGETLSQMWDIVDTNDALVEGYKEELKLLKEQAASWRVLTGIQEKLGALLKKSKETLMASPWLYALVEMSKRIWDTSKAYAEVLQQANSSLEERLELMHKGLQVQIATGASLEEVGGAMQAMLSAGLKNSATFKDDLQTAVMMNKALGVGKETAAQLARASNMVGADFRKVADVVARVSELTGLSADDAAKMSAELGKAIRVWLPAQQRGGFAGAAKELTLFAGALKSVGGVAEDITKLSTEIISARNLTAASMLGVNMQMMGTKEGAKLMKERLAELSKQLQGNPFLIQAYSKMLGISAETLATASEALEKENKIRATYGDLLDTNEALQKRYNAQMADTGEAIGMLRNTFNALLGEALLPINTVLMATARFLTFLIQGIGEAVGGTKVLAGIITAGLVVAFVFVVKAVKTAVIAIWQFIDGVRRLVNEMLKARNVPGIPVGGGGGGGGGGMGWKGMVAGGALALGGSLAMGGEGVGGELVSVLGGLLPYIGSLKSGLMWIAESGLPKMLIPFFKSTAVFGKGLSMSLGAASIASTALAAASVAAAGMTIWAAGESVRRMKREQEVTKELGVRYKGMISNMQMTENNMKNLSRTVDKLNQTQEGQNTLSEAIAEAQEDYNDSMMLASSIKTGLGGFASQEEEKRVMSAPAMAAAKLMVLQRDTEAADQLAKGNSTQEQIKTILEDVKKKNTKTAEETEEMRRQTRLAIRRKQIADLNRGDRGWDVMGYAKAAAGIAHW